MAEYVNGFVFGAYMGIVVTIACFIIKDMITVYIRTKGGN